MKNANRIAACFLFVITLLVSAVPRLGEAADHNDPNAVNSIFSDIAIQAADLYGMFAYPSADRANGDKLVVQLTFASIPATGVFDPDMLYTIHLDADPRIEVSSDDSDFDGMLSYIGSIKDKYFRQRASQIRVSFADPSHAVVTFIDFPGEDFSTTVNVNEVTTIDSPDGHAIETFVGGRDDPFFNDLPGFFRSINYGPQFYDIPFDMPMEYRELPIPKTLLELEGNTLFNYDPANPRHGSGVKEPMPDGPITWSGDRFLRDADGNFRLVYSGIDAQAGMNVNAIAFEVPLAIVTTNPERDRVVRVWGESWVLKASGKVARAPEKRGSLWSRFWAWWVRLLTQERGHGLDDVRMKDFKLVDHVGVPFADAALGQRSDEKVGHNNIRYGRDFVRRFAHLGWGFGPSISALGLGTCFDHDSASVSVHRTYDLATAAFPRVKRCLFQELNMPDDSWNTSGKTIPLRRVFEIVVPNVTSVDMDTNGSWPFGRRLEDQVATRFLSVFLDQERGCGGQRCNVDTLGDQALWDGAPVVPKTPLNPLANDKPFLTEFPYLADPWQ